jgi:hypothetical protein
MHFLQHHASIQWLSSWKSDMQEIHRVHFSLVTFVMNIFSLKKLTKLNHTVEQMVISREKFEE